MNKFVCLINLIVYLQYIKRLKNNNYEKAKSKIIVVGKRISLKFKYLKFKNKIEKNKIIMLILLILIVKEKIESRSIKTT